jgi:hypothetical protein
LPLWSAVPLRGREALVRANNLMASKRFVEAAGICEHLAQAAKQRGMIGRAADLTLQATRARFAAGEVDAAVERGSEAMRFLVRSGRVGRVPSVLEKITTALRDLPSRCSGCGAPLVPDEVEWHDATTAECLYCGAIVKAGREGQ